MQRAVLVLSCEEGCSLGEVVDIVDVGDELVDVALVSDVAWCF